MVKKLFKHEFLAYVRIMSIVYLILLTVATGSRIILLFEDRSVTYRVVNTFSLITYGVSVFGALAFSFVMGIVRFYKNLFTAEGYLSFTLPVTPTQHILVKTVTAVTMSAITFLVVLLSGCIITSGEVFAEIWKAAVFLLERVYRQIGFHSVLAFVELLLLLILMLTVETMLYFACIAIGQMFRKNRILAAVGAYFVYYIINQVISTIFVVAYTALAGTEAFAEFIMKLFHFIKDHPYVFTHSCVWFFIVVYALFVLVEFIIIKRIITRKLNLE